MTTREPTKIHTLAVVLVSPSDVTNERASVREIIKDLNLNLGRTFGVVFQLDGWENVHPGLHAGGAQGKIDSYLKICEADLVIGIFSKKFGKAMSNGQTPTEHEIRDAYRCWLVSHRPQLTLYFNGEGVQSPTLADLEQLKSIVSFRQEFLPNGIVSDYIGANDFANRVRNDLMYAMGEAIASRMTPEGVPCALSAEPKLLRGEGATELVGEVRMSIPQRPDLGEVEADFHVFLNTNITNAVDSHHGAIEPLLVVERLPGDTSDYPASRARIVGANALLFSSVKLPLKGPGGVRTFRLLGIRANALQLMSPGTAPRVILTVVVESKDFPSITVLNPTVTVGFSYHSFIVGSSVALFDRAHGINADFLSETTSPEISFHCTIEENLPDAFKNRTQESLAGAYQGSISHSVAVEHGTLFEVTFVDVPSGVRIYASVSDQSGDSAMIRLISPTSDGSATERATRMRLLPNTGGRVTGVWEWNSEDPISPLTVNTIRIGFALVASPGEAVPGSAKLYVNLGPVSNELTCSSTAPIPRFGFVATSRLAFTCHV